VVLFYTTFGIGIVITVLLFFFKTPILHFIGTSYVTFSYADGYFSIIAMFIVADILSNTLCVTKAAVSQMLSVLERKAYVLREINQNNQGKQVLLSLTAKGETFIEENDRSVDKVMEKMITRFGKSKIKELIVLLDDFTRMIDDIKEGRMINRRNITKLLE
jgi:DNA-binding MarR family transcriptional regulator